MARLSPLVHYPFLIPQTATFCIAMDVKRNSSFAAKFQTHNVMMQLVNSNGNLDAGGRLLPPPDASLVHGIIGWSRRYRSCWLEVGFAGMTAEPIPLPPSNPRCLPSPLSNAYAR